MLTLELKFTSNGSYNFFQERPDQKFLPVEENVFLKLMNLINASKSREPV